MTIDMLPSETNAEEVLPPTKLSIPNDKQYPTFVQVLCENKNFVFYVKVFIAWFVWLFSATVVYAIRNDLGWGQGFYMAVNVGYSIGWGYPLEKDNKLLWYSIFHVLVGASAVAASLAFFAQSVVSSSKEWYNGVIGRAGTIGSAHDIDEELVMGEA